MTLEELLSTVKNPDEVNVDAMDDLREISQRYPYFYAPHLFLSKIMKETNNLNFKDSVDLTALYASDKRWLYFYLHPEDRLARHTSAFKRVDKFSGSYFDMVDGEDIEGDQAKHTLRNIAQRLKEARSMVTEDEVQEQEPVESPNVEAVQEDVVAVIVTMPIVPIADSGVAEDEQVTEDDAKKLIKAKKYEEAIEILKKLNLIYPKKSVYFADQIRFLEKVTANTKK